MFYFVTTFRRLKHHRLYFAYALASGLSSLVIPLGTQFLVNKLSLAGIWANTLSFLLIIAVVAVLSQIFRHSQVILMEYLQREIFTREIRRWRHLRNSDYSHYYFEIYTLLKSFAKTYGDLIDMALITFFGVCTVIIFHPAFIVLPVTMLVVFLLAYRNYRPALETSLQESNRKYEIYDLLRDERSKMTTASMDYLRDRDKHFVYIRKLSFRMSFLFVFCTMYTLGMGSFLIHVDQLSVGQLVAAELIISGIMIALLKLPSSLESLYDFETSNIKIEKALKRS